MSLNVCLAANALIYPEGGGHLWVYLNWALGLRALGCRVIWLEGVDPALPVDTIQAYVTALKQRLERYGLAECVALCSRTEASLPRECMAGFLDLEVAAEADVFLTLLYGMPAQVVQRFPRSALIDIDPG